MAVDPKVYDDKLLEIINSLQIPPSLEEQLSIGATDLLAPSWNLPGGPEGGIYPLMPGMEYAPSMATTPIIAPPKGGPEPPPSVDPADPGPGDPGPIRSAPSDGLPPAGGGTGPVSIPGFDPEMGWTLEFIDKVLGGDIDFTERGHGVPFGEGPGTLENLRNWFENRNPDITLPVGDFNPDWLDPDFDWGNPDDITPNLQPVPLDTWPTGEIDEINIDLDPDKLFDPLKTWDDFLADAPPEDSSEESWRSWLADKLQDSSGLIPGLGGNLLGDLIEGGIGGIQDLLGAIPGIGDIFKPGGGIANLLDRGSDAFGNIRGGIGNLLGLGNLPFFGGPGRGFRGWLGDLFDEDEVDADAEVDVESVADGGIAGYPRVNALIEGPGTEKSDDIKAMLSDGEFVTNAAALRGIGRLNGADPKDKEEQRRIGAREMYRLQHAGEKAAGVA